MAEAPAVPTTAAPADPASVRPAGAAPAQPTAPKPTPEDIAYLRKNVTAELADDFDDRFGRGAAAQTLATPPEQDPLEGVPQESHKESIVRGAVRGFAKAGLETIEFAADVVNATAVDPFLRLLGYQPTTRASVDEAVRSVPVVGEAVADAVTIAAPERLSGQLTEGLTQFLGAWVGAGKLRSAASLVRNADLGVAASTAQSAGIAASSFDPFEGNLANVAESLGVSNFLTDLLAVDENDPAALARVKNSFADAAVGIPLSYVAPLVRFAKKTWAGTPTTDDVLESVARADDALDTPEPPGAPVADPVVPPGAPGKAPVGAPEAPVAPKAPEAAPAPTGAPEAPVGAPARAAAAGTSFPTARSTPAAPAAPDAQARVRAARVEEDAQLATFRERLKDSQAEFDRRLAQGDEAGAWDGFFRDESTLNLRNMLANEGDDSRLAVRILDDLVESFNIRDGDKTTIADARRVAEESAASLGRLADADPGTVLAQLQRAGDDAASLARRTAGYNKLAVSLAKEADRLGRAVANKNPGSAGFSTMDELLDAFDQRTIVASRVLSDVRRVSSNLGRGLRLQRLNSAEGGARVSKESKDLLAGAGERAEQRARADKAADEEVKAAEADSAEADELIRDLDEPTPEAAPAPDAEDLTDTLLREADVEDATAAVAKEVEETEAAVVVAKEALEKAEKAEKTRPAPGLNPKKPPGVNPGDQFIGDAVGPRAEAAEKTGPRLVRNLDGSTATDADVAREVLRKAEAAAERARAAAERAAATPPSINPSPVVVKAVRDTAPGKVGPRQYVDQSGNPVDVTERVRQKAADKVRARLEETRKKVDDVVKQITEGVQKAAKAGKEAVGETQFRADETLKNVKASLKRQQDEAAKAVDEIENAASIEDMNKAVAKVQSTYAELLTSLTEGAAERLLRRLENSKGPRPPEDAAVANLRKLIKEEDAAFRAQVKSMEVPKPRNADAAKALAARIKAAKQKLDAGSEARRLMRDNAKSRRDANRSAELERLAELMKHQDSVTNRARLLLASKAQGFWDVASTARIQYMLSGLGTHVAAVATNAGHLGLILSDGVVGGVTRAATGGGMHDLRVAASRIYQTGAQINGVLAATRDAALTGRSQLDVRGTGSVEKFTPQVRYDQLADAVRAGDVVRAGGLALQAFLNLPTRALVVNDEFFRQLSYRSAIAAEAAVTGKDVGHKGEALKRFIDSEVARAFDADGAALDKDALKAAQVATFSNDFNPAGPMGTLQRFINSNPATKMLVPFFRSPARVIEVFLRRGLIVPELFSAAFAKSPTARHQALARATSGAMLWGAGVALYDAKLVTGAGPMDAEGRRLYKDAVGPPSSIKIGDTWVGINRFGPFSDFFTTVATFGEALKIAEGQDAEDLSALLVASMARSVASKNMFKGLTDVIQAVQDPNMLAGDKLEKIVQDIAISYAIPVGVSASNMDPYQREAYNLLDRLKRRIPGLSDSLDPQRDFRGNAELSSLYSGHMPGQVFEDSKDDVGAKIGALALRTGAKFNKPAYIQQGIDLREWKGKGGRTMYDEFMVNHKELGMDDTYRKLFASKQYKELSDPDQLALVRAVQSDFKDAALKKLIKENKPLEKAMMVMKGQLLEEQHAPGSKGKRLFEK